MPRNDAPAPGYIFMPDCCRASIATASISRQVRSASSAAKRRPRQRQLPRRPDAHRSSTSICSPCLARDERERYARHILLKEIGGPGSSG